jgi:hypothetical protein
MRTTDAHLTAWGSPGPRGALTRIGMLIFARIAPPPGLGPLNYPELRPRRPVGPQGGHVASQRVAKELKHWPSERAAVIVAASVNRPGIFTVGPGLGL